MKYSLSKLDATRQTLDEAVRLFFNQRSPVAIHILACAAHEVLYNIAEKQGVPCILKDNISIDIVTYTGKIKNKDEWIRILNRPYNFFKHADRDPDDTIEFNPRMTQTILFDAISMQRNLDKKDTYVFSLFLYYYLKNNPEIADDYSTAQVDMRRFDMIQDPANLEMYKVCLQWYDELQVEQKQ